jgi:hypothetical protein
MVIAVICNPGAGSTGSVEDREENENLFNDGIQPYGAMRERAMVADGRSQSAESGCTNRCEKDLPARERKKQESHNSQDVDQKQIQQSLTIISIRFPPGLCPGMLFYKRRAICQMNSSVNKIAKY